MRIGLDFDNTIVCYDGVFHRVALEAGSIPAELPVNKLAVRDYLRRIGREDDWTEMQGLVYGPRILEADPFPGVIPFLYWAKAAGIELAIVSQKTIYPFRGERHNLHNAARRWILDKLHGADGSLIPADLVFFEQTKEAKLARVGSLSCTYFIDDLPEILLAPTFPAGVTSLWFDSAGAEESAPGLTRMESWNQIRSFIEDAWATSRPTRT